VNGLSYRANKAYQEFSGSNAKRAAAAEANLLRVVELTLAGTDREEICRVVGITARYRQRLAQRARARKLLPPVVRAVNYPDPEEYRPPKFDDVLQDRLLLELVASGIRRPVSVRFKHERR
jgi:hypothetical protein